MLRGRGGAAVGRLVGLAAAAGVAAAFAVASTSGHAEAPGAARARGASRAENPAAPRLTPRAVADATVEDGRLVAALEGGGRAVLTLDPALQAHLAHEMARYDVPFGAVVAIEPATGRVLAHVSHSSANPVAGDLALDATPPAASVFKVITGAALVDAGVAPDTRVCWSGGLRGFDARHLVDDPSRDRRCNTLAEAMGGSINVVFAKLAARHLDDATLERYASAFGFGHALPYELPAAASALDIPSSADEPLEFARTAAGFWHTHLSPLHGAVVAAIVANDGVAMRPTLVERWVDADGHVRPGPPPVAFRSVIPRRTARLVGEMMEHTCRRDGTAGEFFYDPAGRPFLPGVRVAGKTGSLTANEPFRAYSWWVGYAPLEAPRVAVAALVVNRPEWRIKGSYLGREALRHLLLRPTTDAAAAPAPPPAAAARP